MREEPTIIVAGSNMSESYNADLRDKNLYCISVRFSYSSKKVISYCVF